MNISSRKRHGALLARIFSSLILFFALNTSANAAFTIWINPSFGDWFITTNWSIGVPTSATGGVFSQGGTALITAPGAEARDLLIGTPTTQGPTPATGAVLVSNAGSSLGALTVDNQLSIGISVTAGKVGNGTLTISNGASAGVAGLCEIGSGSQGSTGVATVTDSSSFFNTSAAFYVGRDTGHGTLNIQNGAQVDSTVALIAGSTSASGANSSTGSATVTGANSSWYVFGSPFYIGDAGNGSLALSNGGLVSSSSATIAVRPGSIGTVTVADFSSSWNLSSLNVGYGGNGSLRVSSGGNVSSSFTTIAYQAGSNGAVTVTDPDSSWGGTFLNVGYLGSGLLTISNGGSVVSTTTTIASQAGSVGTATVTGGGSSWATDNLYIGGRDGGSGASVNGGSGTLRIQAGGLVQASNLKFFNNGVLEVDNGSSVVPGLIVSGNNNPIPDGGVLGDMAVGTNTAGRMEIRTHGQVYCNRGYLGFGSGSSGSALVTGFRSYWNNSGSIFVGNGGDGTFEIRDGGQVFTNGNFYIGFTTSTTGSVIVSNSPDNRNAAYLLAVNGTLFIGGNGAGPGGSGVLRLQDAYIRATAVTLYNTGGLQLGGVFGFDAPLNVRGGFIQFLTPNLIFYNDFGLGAEGVYVYTAGQTATMFGVISGTGGITKSGGSTGLGAGTLILTGSNTYTGPTSVVDGTLLVDGSITSPVTVNSGAVLGGSGAVGDVTVNSGGLVSPGDSPGILTVNGNYNQTSAATLKIEIGGASPGVGGFDQVAASGLASVGGTLNVSLINGFRPNIGDTFQIITSNGETGNFSTINSNGFTVRSDPSPSGIVLTVISIDPLLRIISILRSGNDIVVTYNATGGKTYRLERKLAVTDATWNAIPGVGDQTPAVNGPTQFGPDSGALSLGKAFYRVRLLP